MRILKKMVKWIEEDGYRLHGTCQPENREDNISDLAYHIAAGGTPIEACD